MRLYLINYFKFMPHINRWCSYQQGQSKLHGLTGLVQFDNEGLRTNIALDIMELSYNGLHRIGTWNSTENDGLRITRLLPPPSGQENESLQNKTFIVLTALVMR
jgi:hypothetical protein